MHKNYYFSIFLFVFSFSIRAELTIWVSKENVQAALRERADIFEKDLKQKVKIEVLGNNVVTQFKTAAMANKGPDIIVWAHDVVGELAQSGLIEPLQLTKQFTNDFYKSSIDAFTYEGKIYGYPYDVEAVALVYNTTIFKDEPQSFEEIFKISKSMQLKNKYKKNKTYGFLYDINNFFFSFPLLSAGGGYIFNTNNKVLNIEDIGLNNQGAIDGMNFIKKLAISKVVPASTDRSVAFKFMKNSRLGAMIDGPWAVKDLTAAKVSFKIIPLPKLGGHRPKAFVGSHGFMIRRKSKNSLLAKEFIERYLVTKEGIHQLFINDPRGPSRPDVIPLINKQYPHLEAFLKSASNGIPMPNIPQMGAVWGAMKNALELVTSGKADSKETLNHSVKSIKHMIEKGK